MKERAYVWLDVWKDVQSYICMDRRMEERTYLWIDVWKDVNMYG